MRLPLLFAFGLLACGGAARPAPEPTPPSPPAPSSTAGASAALPSPAATLLARANAAIPDAVAFATRHGARIVPTDRTFYVASPAPAGAPTLVSLHGHEGWAFNDWKIWQPSAEARAFGVISMQWWVGSGDRTEDYLPPPALYAAIDGALRAGGATPGGVMLHGFSRGATLTYALAAMDAHQGHWFGTVLANAGGAHVDFPPTGEVDRGRYGERPYDGQRWILYCGGRDADPQINGCPAMRKTETWVRARGGDTTLLVDEAADHGGFHHDGRLVGKALDSWLGRE